MTDYKHLRELAEKQIKAHARMVEIGEGVGGLGVRHPEMFEDLMAWDDATESDHSDTVVALLDELERFERDYPCDGGCSYGDGPQEECSRHGRTPADLWGIVTNLIKERDELQARIDAALRIITEHAVYRVQPDVSLIQAAFSTPTENGEEQ